MESNAEEAIQKLLKNKKLNFVKGDSDSFTTNRIPFNIPQPVELIAKKYLFPSLQQAKMLWNTLEKL